MQPCGLVGTRIRLAMMLAAAAVFCGSAYHERAEASGSSGVQATVAAAPQRSVARQPKRSVWTGVYTDEQATRGQAAYREHCSRCHRDDTSGGGEGPQLTGPNFFDRWHDLTLFDVFTEIQSAMPHDYEVFISADAARDVVAYLLQKNGIPAGKDELSKEFDDLRDILITRPSTNAK